MRRFNAKLIAPILRATGYRFDKSWRWEETPFKGFVYNYVLSTCAANHDADKTPILNFNNLSKKELSDYEAEMKRQYDA